jgi:hypothetical protein
MMYDRKRFIRWALPYGKWTCADGREVLFNRRYVPIYQRYPGQLPTPADPNKWVEWKDEQWFYNDGTSEARKLKAVLKILDEWGIADQALTAAKEMEKQCRIKKHMVGRI